MPSKKNFIHPLKVPVNIQKIYEEALKAFHRAYAPYSNFPAGAAFQTKSRRIFAGCNVENSSYGGTICAERVAVFKAVSEGSRDLSDLVVLTRTKFGVPPCALCLQIISEFASADLKIWIGNPDGIFSVCHFRDLLKTPFLKSSLDESKELLSQSRRRSKR